MTSGPVAKDPVLSLLDEPANAALVAASRRVTLAPGTVVFRPGEACRRWLVVLSGSIRVRRTDRAGRTMMLYRVGPGQTCILTTTGLIEGADYDAEAVTEGEVLALVMAGEDFLRLLGEQPRFRRFAFLSYARRIAALMTLAGELAFDEVGERLARHLLALAGEDGLVPSTHEMLAEELATAREVVSRRLKAFERAHLVRLSRGRIEVVDRAGLAAAAEGGEGEKPRRS
ncbi:MAG: Crp/Fnr family transcriptional regulator [Rubritepida sp.]|jgi:CRP/FNR family transcriptional regulator|nr:Crp/Fnr family transcriptional regulator [Rubritepida sp.]